MAVSQSAIASEGGARILCDGGNAVDAAIAMRFALAVTLPRAATPAMFVDEKGKERAVANYGYLAPGVPSTVAGLDYAHRKCGKLPWEKLVAPAIAIARDGVRLTADEAFVFRWGKARLSKSDAGKAAFYKADDSLCLRDEVMKHPELAWTLGEMARHGADGFYKGEVARRIATDMTAHGGRITIEDLAAYRPVERDPLVGSYRGYTIYTAPAASAGGPAMLNILNQLEHFDLKAMGLARPHHRYSRADEAGLCLSSARSAILRSSRRRSRASSRRNMQPSGPG